jgi:hypothetical protein
VHTARDLDPGVELSLHTALYALEDLRVVRRARAGRTIERLVLAHSHGVDLITHAAQAHHHSPQPPNETSNHGSLTETIGDYLNPPRTADT